MGNTKRIKSQNIKSKKRKKRCGECNIIIEGKSYTFVIPKTTFIINKNSSNNSKNVVYVSSNVQTATKCILDVHKHWRIESFCIRVTLNYLKIDNFMYQSIFMNAASETLK